MPKLFIAAGACSFGTHVVARELQLPIEIVKVPLRTPDSPIHHINPLGRVPALQLDNGEVITENSAILPFLADQTSDHQLFAPVGSSERAKIQSWIGYLSSELHVGAFRPFNRPERYLADSEQHPAIKAQARTQIESALQHLEKHLQDGPYLVGQRFTIADAYLGVFLGWISRFNDLLSQYPGLQRAYTQFTQRPSVQQSLAFEQA
ncbi:MULTISPECIES: glutathione S-transferase C-terminal domain-containing protein [Chitinibacter]|uniref:glutathione S-transferase C-terminal domain-containing protein n=1 Tax=Chitinibacter TaxID=230666 RepID=UPI000647F7AD|nr:MULTISPECIES: glutathione S-transferase C-terminal domain-containing protein [Chitinibacter]